MSHISYLGEGVVGCRLLLCPQLAFSFLIRWWGAICGPDTVKGRSSNTSQCKPEVLNEKGQGRRDWARGRHVP